MRLRFAYFIKCTDVIKDEMGNIIEVHCTYDPETKGGSAPDGRKVKVPFTGYLRSIRSQQKYGCMTTSLLQKTPMKGTP